MALPIIVPPVSVGSPPFDRIIWRIVAPTSLVLAPGVPFYPELQTVSDCVQPTWQSTLMRSQRKIYTNQVSDAIAHFPTKTSMLSPNFWNLAQKSSKAFVDIAASLALRVYSYLRIKLIFQLMICLVSTLLRIQL